MALGYGCNILNDRTQVIGSASMWRWMYSCEEDDAECSAPVASLNSSMLILLCVHDYCDMMKSEILQIENDALDSAVRVSP